MTRFRWLSVLALLLLAPALSCRNDDSAESDDDDQLGECAGQPLIIDRVGLDAVVAPAGVRVKFRVLDCLGRGVDCIDDSQVVVINDEKGTAFNLSSEGGSASGAGLPSNLELYSVLILDFSDSIFANDAEQSVIAGAQAYVDAVVRQAPTGLRHQVAVIAFGSSANTELVVPFTDDLALLDAGIAALANTQRGTTNLYGAYVSGLELLDGVGLSGEIVEKFAVIMTDGTHEAGDENNLRAQALDAKQLSGADICSIGIAGDYQASAIEALATSPAVNGAPCFYPNVAVDGLAQVFAEVSERAQLLARANYSVGVCTPIELGDPTLTIEVSIGESKGTATIAYPTDQLTGDLSACDAVEVADLVTQDGCDGGGDPSGDGDGDGDPSGDGDGDGDGDPSGDGDGTPGSECGDGVVESGEACDDGNVDNTDSCTTLCQLPACDDELVSGDETDVDCGGSCVGCGIGLTCEVADDCLSESCENSLCSVSAQIEAGGYHTCALLEAGTVRCWGHADAMGYGNLHHIGDDEFPASVGDVDVGEAVVQLTAGRHTCALLEGGMIRCWGSGGTGQLGYGNTNDIGDNELPTSAGNVDVGGVVVQLTAGGQHTCALLEGGAVRCWGDADFGQLGYGNTNTIGDNESPASAGDVDVGGVAVQLTAGFQHTCALLQGGAVRCWGRGESGRLGYGNTNTIGDNESPASAGNVNVGGTVVQLTAGGEHNCALLQGGIVRCWGNGYRGQLGYGNQYGIGDDELPASAGNVNVGGTVVQLTAGYEHTCALLQGGIVRCWGEGIALGYGNQYPIGDNELPASAGNVDVGGPVVQLTAGEKHTCALLGDNAIRCWGDGYYGKLGHGNTNTIGQGGNTQSVVSAGDVPYL